MKRLLPAALCLLLLNGCLFWNKKSSSKPTKENPKVATGVEQEFRERWIDKRTSDLVATGLGTTQAHAQAVSEYDQKFSQTHSADPAK